MTDEQIAREIVTANFTHPHTYPILTATIAAALAIAHRAGFDACKEQAAEACWATQKEVLDCVKAGGDDVPLYRLGCHDCEEAIRALEPSP